MRREERGQQVNKDRHTLEDEESAVVVVFRGQLASVVSSGSRQGPQWDEG